MDFESEDSARPGADGKRRRTWLGGRFSSAWVGVLGVTIELGSAVTSSRTSSWSEIQGLGGNGVGLSGRDLMREEESEIEGIDVERDK